MFRDCIARSLFAAALTSLAPTAIAQVPDGWLVTGHLRFPNASGLTPGSAGIWLHHPTNPGESVRVTGLPAALTGDPALAFTGTFGVEALADGRVAASTVASVGSMVELHFVSMTGSVGRGFAYDAPNSYSIALGRIGTLFGAGGAWDIEQLSETEFLLCVAGISSGPLADAVLGRVTITGPRQATVARVPVTGLPAGYLTQGMATDGATVWFTYTLFSNPRAAEIWAVPIQGGAAYRVAALSPPYTFFGGIQFEAPSTLWVSGSGTLGRLDLTTGQLDTVSYGVSQSIVFDPVSTDWYAHDGVGNAVIRTGNGLAPGRLLHTPPTGGWGDINDIDIKPSLPTYGTSGPAPAPVWLTAGNGIPLGGNPGFQLALLSGSGGAAFCLASLAADAVALPMFGITLNVNPSLAIPLSIGPSGANLAVPLPIPAFVAPGTALYLQAFELTGGGFSASTGLRVTTL